MFAAIVAYGRDATSTIMIAPVMSALPVLVDLSKQLVRRLLLAVFLSAKLGNNRNIC